MFEEATRLKIRYETRRGQAMVEDLWDLPLTSNTGVSLDNIAKECNKQVKSTENESFVLAKSKKDVVLELKFAIVKHVIKVRLAEAKEEEEKEINRQKKKNILGIIEDKKNENLKGKSIKELEKEAKKL